MTISISHLPLDIMAQIARYVDDAPKFASVSKFFQQANEKVYECFFKKYQQHAELKIYCDLLERKYENNPAVSYKIRVQSIYLQMLSYRSWNGRTKMTFNNLRPERLQKFHKLKQCAELSSVFKRIDRLGKDKDIFVNSNELKNISCLEKAKKISSWINTYANKWTFERLDLRYELTFLPEEIGLLENLQVLDVANNKLVTLPESLGNLKQLKVLRLNNNKLQALPETIGNLQSLEQLDLCYNWLRTLPKSFGNLKCLINLDLHNNQLRDLPESFGNLERLKKLQLYNNELKTLPASFPKLDLTDLLFFNNPLNSIPDKMLYPNDIIKNYRTVNNTRNMASFSLRTCIILRRF
jgi:hypothetical protein